jgi:hypothetical protein
MANVTESGRNYKALPFNSQNWFKKQKKQSDVKPPRNRKAPIAPPSTGQKYQTGDNYEGRIDTKTGVPWARPTTKSKPKSTKSSGGGGGGGGGTNAAKKTLKGAEYWRPGTFNEEAGLRAGAAAQVDAQLAEKYRQNQVARGQYGADYQNAIGELQRARDAGLVSTEKSGAADRGRLNNMSMGGGMGVGVGAGTNLSSLMNKYAEIRSGINSGFQSDYGKQTYDYNRNLGDITEADRVLANSRAGEIDTLYRSLYGEAWDRFIQQQTLTGQGIESRNNTRARVQGV